MVLIRFLDKVVLISGPAEEETSVNLGKCVELKDGTIVPDKVRILADIPGDYKISYENQVPDIALQRGEYKNSKLEDVIVDFPEIKEMLNPETNKVDYDSLSYSQKIRVREILRKTGTEEFNVKVGNLEIIPVSLGESQSGEGKHSIVVSVGDDGKASVRNAEQD